MSVEHLTKLYSPCGKYCGYFEDGLNPPEWTSEKTHIVSDDEFKKMFFCIEGNAYKMLEEALEQLKENHDCEINTDDVFFSKDECIELLENSIIWDIEEYTPRFVEYTPWENLNHFINFLDDALGKGIKLEVTDIHELLSDNRVGFGTLDFIRSQSLAEFKKEMKERELICLRHINLD